MPFSSTIVITHKGRQLRADPLFRALNKELQDFVTKKHRSFVVKSLNDYGFALRDRLNRYAAGGVFDRPRQVIKTAYLVEKVKAVPGVMRVKLKPQAARVLITQAEGGQRGPSWTKLVPQVAEGLLVIPGPGAKLDSSGGLSKAYVRRLMQFKRGRGFIRPGPDGGLFNKRTKKGKLEARLLFRPKSEINYQQRFRPQQWLTPLRTAYLRALYWNRAYYSISKSFAYFEVEGNRGKPSPPW